MFVWIASKWSHRETGSVLTAQLYGGRIHVSVSVMSQQHHDCDLSTPPLSPFPLHASPYSFLFFSLVMSHSQGWGRSLPDRADKSESCSDWANRENMPASKQNEYTSPTLCLSLFFFFFDLPYLLFRPPTSWKYRGVLSPLEPPLPYSKELLTGRCKKDRSKGNRARKDVGGEDIF